MLLWLDLSAAHLAVAAALACHLKQIQMLRKVERQVRQRLGTPESSAATAPEKTS